MVGEREEKDAREVQSNRERYVQREIAKEGEEREREM